MQPEAINSFISLIFVFAMLVYWTGAFLIFYHLIRFGVGAGPKKLSAVFLGGSLVFTLVAMLLFGQIIS